MHSLGKTLLAFALLHSVLQDVEQNKLWKILQEMKIPDHLICLLRNLYAGQEATARIRHQARQLQAVSLGQLPYMYFMRLYFPPSQSKVTWL